MLVAACPRRREAEKMGPDPDSFLAPTSMRTRTTTETTRDNANSIFCGRGRHRGARTGCVSPQGDVAEREFRDELPAGARASFGRRLG